MPGYFPYQGGAVANPIQLPSGLSTAPALVFSAQVGMGFWRAASNSLGISFGSDEYRIGSTAFNLGGAHPFKWFTGGSYAAVNIGIGPAGASVPRLEVNNGTLTTYLPIIASQVFAGGDSAAGIASSTSLTNVTDATTTNAYVVAGGQAATTENTGWLKIYVGTAVAWIPYWQNATP